MTIEGKVTMSLLFVLSLLSWAVIFSKWIAVIRQRRAMRRFDEAYAELQDSLTLDTEAKGLAQAPALTVYEAMREEIDRQTAKGARSLSERNLPSLHAVLEKSVNIESLALESGTIVLAMAISGGPFIGLTGTVFGVMETFSGVAQAGQANLAAMAPGVAGALVNTIVGLVVAIPALFAYNLITKSIQGIQVALTGFATDLEARVISEHYRGERGERDVPKLAASH
ncbi:MAG TPA: MotA/TolQ/ExbB proton channel family protein [Myxococcota bacterium]|nr:MotA/TolQ/ExbB proton channel family protein [Myxococcota bacterium]